MAKSKVVSKGYTLSVESWENDGDNYKTNELIFESKELAIAVARLCRDLFCSGPGGIGNSDGSDVDFDSPETDDVHKTIIDYMKAHPELYEFVKEPSESELVEICMNYNKSLMDSSEYYYSRVFDSASLTYSPEDTYLEIIEF